MLWLLLAVVIVLAWFFDLGWLWPWLLVIGGVGWFALWVWGKVRGE